MSHQVPSTREWRVSDPPSGYDALRLVEAAIPPLGTTDVLVKVHAVSLHYRDMLIAKGEYALAVKKSPVLGSDAAGAVIAIGSEVTKWALGDRVASNFNVEHVHGDLTTAITHSFLGAPIDGVLTEYQVFPSEALVRIPEHLGWEEASTLPCAGVTAYEALMGGPHPLKGGDTVLIEGTGGVSIFALQFVLASGATPIVTTSSDAKASIARELGAQHVINYNTTPDWEKEVLKLTGGEGVDHGAGHRVHTVEPATNVYLSCLMKAIVLRGILVGSRTQFENMNRLISAKKIKPVVDKVFEFEQLVDALRYLESQKHVGKVVVKVA